MKPKKAVLLFLALLFPACIFVFLKFFGRNEFNVPPLYTDAYPDEAKSCNVAVTLPYHIPEDIQSTLGDSLTLIQFGESTTSAEQQMSRVINEHGKEFKLQSLPLSDSVSHLKKCVFFLKDQYDLVLVDNEGTIRGQYVSGDREEIDRLIMELSILLKKY
jgi:hypothetical protein